MSGITKAQKQVRQNVRNFLLTATHEQLLKEYRLSMDAGDKFRAMCVNEIILENEEEHLFDRRD